MTSSPPNNVRRSVSLAQQAIVVAAALLLAAIGRGVDEPHARASGRALPRVTAIDVQLATANPGAPPADCAQWPSCSPAAAPNARLSISFATPPHPTAAPAAGPEQSIQLDLGAAALTNLTLTPGATPTYSGNFCFDARALCEQAKRDQGREITIFAGREVVRREQARLPDLEGLWHGQEVALLSSVPPGGSIDSSRSLFITGKDIIEDKDLIYTPCGSKTGGDWQPFGTKLAPFSFGRLITLAAGANAPGPFVRDWLLQFDPATPPSVNGFTVTKRPGMRNMFMVPWCKASPAATCDPNDPTTLDLDVSVAPFRLLAIVNRIDLADVFADPTTDPTNGGELRFVFIAEKMGSCDSLIQFFVILEYRVQLADCTALTKWANSWINLASLTDPAAYKAQLQALVDSVVTKTGALARIRTNEVTFAGPLGEGDEGEAWEMRQFEPTAGGLVQTALNRTPDRSFRADPKLASLKTWIEANEPDIDGDRKELPSELAVGEPLLAAASPLRPSAPTLNKPGTFWELPDVGTKIGPDTLTYPDVRHHFSLNTCNGCHGGETSTKGSHVMTTGAFGTPVELSAFLTGGPSGSVADPRNQKNSLNQTVTRTYDDLNRRAQVLKCIAGGLGTPCLCDLTLEKMSMSH